MRLSFFTAALLAASIPYAYAGGSVENLPPSNTSNVSVPGVDSQNHTRISTPNLQMGNGLTIQQVPTAPVTVIENGRIVKGPGAAINNNNASAPRVQDLKPNTASPLSTPTTNHPMYPTPDGNGQTSTPPGVSSSR